MIAVEHEIGLPDLKDLNRWKALQRGHTLLHSGPSVGVAVASWEKISGEIAISTYASNDPGQRYFAQLAAGRFTGSQLLTHFIVRKQFAAIPSHSSHDFSH